MILSIIVPVYNMASGGRLEFCINSLLNQSLKEPYEIIAVNDASTDDSLTVLRQFEGKYPDRVKVVTYEKNRHQGGAKNEGMRVSQGKWIGFVDADDWVSPDYFEKMIKRGEETGADVVGCTYSLVHEHTYEIGQVCTTNRLDQSGVFTTELRKKFLKSSGSGVTKIYLSTLIKENQLSFPENIFYEDNAAGPVWAMYYRHFEYIDEPLYYYYQHEASTVHLITAQKCQDRVIAGEMMLEEFKKRGFFEEYYHEIESVFTMTYYVNTVFSYMRLQKGKKYSFVKHIHKVLLQNFPDFRKNEDYGKYMDPEQLKYTDIFVKNPFLFFAMYGLLWKYREIKLKSKSKG